MIELNKGTRADNLSLLSRIVVVLGEDELATLVRIAEQLRQKRDAWTHFTSAWGYLSPGMQACLAEVALVMRARMGDE